MNRSTRRTEGTVMPYYKERSFRKLSDLIETLVALDFRGSGIRISVDPVSLSTDLSVMTGPFSHKNLTFQIVPDGSIMVLGPGFSDSHQQISVIQLSKIIERFLKEHKPTVN
jgi:hypothetical protein